MGTNYYLRTRNKELLDKYFVAYEAYPPTPEEKYFEFSNINGNPIKEDSVRYSYMVHIAKRSCGWQPLFQYHPMAFTSVRDLIKFYKKHEDEFDIVNEYGDIFNLKEFKREVIDWGKRAKPFKAGVLPSKYQQGKTEIREIEPGDNYTGPVITGPFSHLEYEDLYNKYVMPYNRVMTSRYIKDADGYELTADEFS